MKGLLLAGGNGTRLRPLTFTGNKHMLPIANKPMLFYGMEHLRNAGINEIGVIVGPHKKDIIEALGDGTKFNVKITYIDQPIPKGLAHAIMCAKDFLQKDDFVMYLGDNLLKNGVKSLIQEFQTKQKDCVVGVSISNNPSNYGVVVFNENDEIETLVEKPKEFISKWALIGVYVFNYNVFEALKTLEPSQRGEYEITDTINWLHNNGYNLGIQKVEGWWKDTGKTEDILEANKLVLQDQERKIQGTISKKAIINGQVRIGNNTIIKDNVTIQGPVKIGNRCIISEAHIGPYTSISDNVELAKVKISNSIIMENTIIDSNIELTDSLIGREVVIKNSSSKKGHVLILGDKTTVLI